MRMHTESDLNDNAWTERIGQLRQMVAEQYDTTEASNTPQNFVDWLVESAEEEFYIDDVRIMMREANKRYAEQYGDGMTPERAIEILAASRGANNDDATNEAVSHAVSVLAAAVSEESETGDPNDGLVDWIAAGDYTGYETVESIAAEWDEAV